MEDKLPTLQIAATNFVQRLKSNDLAQVIDFDSRVEIRQGFTANQNELQAAIQQTSAGGSTSLYNAIYISLKELAKMKTGGDEDVRRQALVLFSDGEDTSSLISFDEVLELAKRSETAIFTIALRGADTQSKGFHEAEFVMRQLAQETGGRSFFPSKIDDLNGVYAEIADELASQYTLGYSSKNAKRDGAYRRIVVQIDPTERDAAHQAGLLRPDIALNALPLLLYAAAGVAYAIHFARRDAMVGRAATTLLLFGALVHTFVIGMQTMEVRHVPFSNPSRAVSTFVWLLTLSYLYLELTADERAMGVFILPIIVALQVIPVIYPGMESADPVLDSSVVLGARVVAAVRLRQLRAGRRPWPHLHAAVQGDQEEAPRLLLHPPPLAADSRRDEFARGGGRLAVPHDRRRGRRGLDGAGARHRAQRPEPPGDVAQRSEDFHRASLTWGIYSFAVFARRTLAWSGRRAAWLSALGFGFVMLNFLLINYFVDDEPHFLHDS